uniref:Uncharacterized protein n=1 Tax=Spongospora subterranea TaxID=70186 RepID=A0A0H5QNF0_9EUKA|eukprot:CRZ03107.1 hypothetical protein [Spongospora subterranea]
MPSEALNVVFTSRKHFDAENILSSGNYCSQDPNKLKAFTKFQHPVNATQLMQFLCAATWLSSSIPNFVESLAPLRLFLEHILENAPVRTKKFAARISLKEAGWNEEHRKPDIDQVPCMFTDASQAYWMIAITQVPPDDLNLPVARP